MIHLFRNCYIHASYIADIPIDDVHVSNLLHVLGCVLDVIFSVRYAGGVHAYVPHSA